MFTQLVAGALQALIAAGLLFQLAALTRCVVRAAGRRSARVRLHPAAAQPAPVRVTRIRRRDYRIALRLARASVAA